MFAVSPSKIKLFVNCNNYIFSDHTYDWLISVVVEETQLMEQIASQPSENLNHAYFLFPSSSHSMSGEDDFFDFLKKFFIYFLYEFCTGGFTLV